MDVKELRAAERFSATQPLPATFAGNRVGVLNLSLIGAQIEHPAPIRLGSAGRLILRSGEIAVEIDALLIWSRLSKTPDAEGKYLYRSGLRIDGGNREYALGLHMLIKGGAMRHEANTLERKRQRLLQRMAEMSQANPRAFSYVPEMPDVSNDQLLLVQHARERLLTHPEEAQKWYQRAKYAITHGASNIAVESLTKDREEVLAVWEYLERSVDVPIIVAAFARLRRA